MREETQMDVMSEGQQVRLETSDYGGNIWEVNRLDKLQDEGYMIDVIKSKSKDIYNFVKALKRNH